MRDALNLDEVHLTGGAHPRLAAIVSIGRSAGFRVCTTSNGENGARVIADCTRSGLDRVNFSISGTTAGELAPVQHERFADAGRAEAKIRALGDSVRMTLAHGTGTSACIVVPSYHHASRIRRLMEEYAPGRSSTFWTT